MAKRGETPKKIMEAATELFFEKGFEATSVKMILEKADVVTGSFYHFFTSKEALFEVVIEQFLKNYAERVGAILCDEAMEPHEQLRSFFRELKQTSAVYYDVLQGNRLHWTMEHALHNKTLILLIASFSKMLNRQEESGVIKSKLNVDNTVLAAMVVHGIEAILHRGASDAFLEGGVSKETMKQIQELIESVLSVSHLDNIFAGEI